MLLLPLVSHAVPLPKPVALQPAAALRAANSSLPITKAERDKRRYRGLQLANGMRTVLVSDPDAEMTAASVDVHVGSWSDPDDLPGLAHFCEHMLFMSSTKHACSPQP
jgi:insulysin